MRTSGDNEEMQQMANARLWACIEEVGGITTIMDATGLSRQTLYGIKDNRSMPSGLTIGTIQRAVPELDVNLLYAEGKELSWRKSQPAGLVRYTNSDPDPTTPAPAAPGVNWHKMYETERAENIRLSKANERLTEKNERLYLTLLEKNGIMTDQEGSKIESSSQTTAWAEVRQMEEEARERMQVDGYVRYQKNEATVKPMHSAKVMALPVTRVDQQDDANAA
ncbi:hypothetical protein [Spirosoma sp. KUDC1026]|uniref:hypothetical protein n=1 Tax=Spirosoma sp. KUDC1026 TaxID=2745947 RepID=UPI00159BB0C5|nr:hypothetical protein [Spirosoma sp. KUDC1026]QKZ15145.1 hypothetical protein HU175_21990 [Spirosoma sp. KUDC1026]